MLVFIVIEVIVLVHQSVLQLLLEQVNQILCHSVVQSSVLCELLANLSWIRVAKEGNSRFFILSKVHINEKQRFFILWVILVQSRDVLLALLDNFLLLQIQLLAPSQWSRLWSVSQLVFLVNAFFYSLLQVLFNWRRRLSSSLSLVRVGLECELVSVLLELNLVKGSILLASLFLCLLIELFPLVANWLALLFLGQSFVKFINVWLLSIGGLLLKVQDLRLKGAAILLSWFSLLCLFLVLIFILLSSLYQVIMIWELWLSFIFHSIFRMFLFKYFLWSLACLWSECIAHSRCHSFLQMLVLWALQYVVLSALMQQRVVFAYPYNFFICHWESSFLIEFSNALWVYSLFLNALAFLIVLLLFLLILRCDHPRLVKVHHSREKHFDVPCLNIPITVVIVSLLNFQELLP